MQVSGMATEQTLEWAGPVLRAPGALNRSDPLNPRCRSGAAGRVPQLSFMGP